MTVAMRDKQWAWQTSTGARSAKDFAPPVRTQIILNEQKRVDKSALFFVGLGESAAAGGVARTAIPLITKIWNWLKTPFGAGAAGGAIGGAAGSSGKNPFGGFTWTILAVAASALVVYVVVAKAAR